MVKTYNLLKKQIFKNFKNYSNEELVNLYQHTCDEEIIAELYCRNFNYLYRLGLSINFISFEQKVEIILDKLIQSLDRYDCAQNIKFMTFLGKAIYNAFGELKIKRNFKGRHNEDMLSSIDAIDEISGTSLGDIIPADSNDFDEAILKLTIDTDSSLDNKEKLLCRLIIDNPKVEMKELSDALNISTQYVWLIRKRLAKKLKVSLCID